jgi:hypothetical protein
MKQLLTIMILGISPILWGQTTVTFESFNLSSESFLNGSDLMPGEIGYEAGNAIFINDYNAGYDAFNGWAISTTTDTQTPGFTNQFSAITGQGYDGSDTYGVAYAFNGASIRLTGPAAGGVVSGFYVTNSTYAYLGMLEGDDFTKKFGGETGDDPDFFLLSIKKYYNGQLSTDSVDFYLADYRFEDNTQDYLVDEWAFVDLSSLGNVDSLLFTLYSSDSGSLGINTPAYFCIDNFTTLDVMSSNDWINPDIKAAIYPNPASDFLRLEIPNHLSMEWGIYNMNGQEVKGGSRGNSTHTVDIRALPRGSYVLRLITAEGGFSQSFVKS